MRVAPAAIAGIGPRGPPMPIAPTPAHFGRSSRRLNVYRGFSNAAIRKSPTITPPRIMKTFTAPIASAARPRGNAISEKPLNVSM